MAGPDITEDQRGAERAAPERPDEDDLAALARRQIVRHVVRDLVRDAAPTAGATGRTSNQNTMPTRPGSAPNRTRSQTPPPSGMRETPTMYDQDLQALADTRNLQRGVVPTPGVDLQASVTPNLVTEGSLRSHPVGVRKISNAGIILRLSAAVHAAVSGCEELWLTLKLPNRPRPVRIASTVRHCLTDGSEYVYGCEFDWSATNDPLGIAEDLLDFVLETSED